MVKYLRKISKKQLVWGLTFVLLSSIGQLIVSRSAAATASYDWMNGELVVERPGNLDPDFNNYGHKGGCNYQKVFLPNVWGYYEETEECIFQAKSFIYAIYNGILFINLSGSRVMYPVNDLYFASRAYIVPSPNTDDIIYYTTRYRDVPHNIASNNDALHPGYNPLKNFSSMMSMDEKGIFHDAYNTAISSNGKWMVLNTTDLGYVRINMNDMSVKWLGHHRALNESMAISDSGNTFISQVWAENPIRVYSLEGCGIESQKVQSSWSSIGDGSACDSRDISNTINGALGSQYYTSPSIPMFNDEDELQIYVRPNNIGGEGILVKSSSASSSASKLDYLALGDSYSSGEGDIGLDDTGWPYYTYATRGVGGCHLSSRSYPFLLKDFYAIDSDRMQSVACSGAKVAKDYYEKDEPYFGQSNQLKDKAEEEVVAIRKSALETFTPGVVKQIEFVKANRPKVVTLTGGGNDVGFKDVITSCIFATAGLHGKTCDEAVTGTTKRSILGDAIRGQYTETQAIVRSIKNASPETTIYIIGYPSFLADDVKTCPNAALLNSQERTMINEGVSYMNMVLRAAANDTGAKYVDVENSLVGGRLCEGGKYMTGVLNYSDGFDTAQMFHPNALGHQRLAMAIEKSDFSITSAKNPVPIATAIPAKPASFGTQSYIQTLREALIADGAAIAGRAVTLQLGGLPWVIGNTVSLSLYSTPTSLGTFTVTSTTPPTQTVRIPGKIDPGIHMLVAEVTSSDKTVRRYYQYIEIRSSDVDDRDGDGIKDSKDTCLYIRSWIDELSGKDICARHTVDGDIPGLGGGHGYGHWYSQGLHLGHGGHEIPALTS